MTTKFWLSKPLEQNFTLQVTLPLATWDKVAKCLETPQGVVAYPLQRIIGEAVAAAMKDWWATGQEDRYRQPDTSGAEHGT